MNPKEYCAFTQFAFSKGIRIINYYYYYCYVLYLIIVMSVEKNEEAKVKNKLLRKLNFLEWKREGGHREKLVMQRYNLSGCDDYKKYIHYYP